MINNFIEVNYNPLLFIVVAEQQEYKLDSIDFQMVEAALERERSKLRQKQAADAISKYL